MLLSVLTTLALLYAGQLLVLLHELAKIAKANKTIATTKPAFLFISLNFMQS